jgi:Uma2 family endonuclease
MALTRTQHMSEEAYREFSRRDPQGQWELVDGQLRERPGMSVEHGGIMIHLVTLLSNQLDHSEYTLRAQHARLRVSPSTYFIPDIAVIPTALEQALLARPGSLDAYRDPLPLVVEIWSPSTGNDDITEKLPGYQQHGDREIWSIHPYDRTLTAWHKQPDGAYAETLYRGGIVQPASLPGVAFDLDTLFGALSRGSRHAGG